MQNETEIGGIAYLNANAHIYMLYLILYLVGIIVGITGNWLVLHSKTASIFYKSQSSGVINI